jgi:ubiquinone/menaquinone biosynthesis C-methylase UbiE
MKMDPSTTQVPGNLKTRLKDSYDTIAPAYNDWTVQHWSLRLSYLDKLLQLLPAGATNDSYSVLELGCGAGVPVTEKLLSDRRFRIIANDLSSAQLAIGKERLGTERITWVEGDMVVLEFPEGSFDAVLGFYSLIHLPREEQDVMLNKIVRWLKPGGYMLVNFPAEEISGLVMEEWLHKKGWMYWSGWGAGATLEKVKGVGLDVVVGEVSKEDIDASFLWVIARLPR